ncbi:MAG: EpsG family protein [Flavobacterium sp.]|nr:EpsG family protein [Flavobacterium sp.]
MKEQTLLSKTNNVFWFLIFLFSPIIAVILSFKHRHIKISKTIFILFCIFFGFTFVFSTDFNKGSDSARYAANLVEMHQKDLSWQNFTGIFYSGKDGELDILQPLLTYLIALFTEDARFIFAGFAAVFGYFYAQNIWLLFEYITEKLSKVHILFITIFIFLIPIWNINGFRFWTAAQIFLFGTLMFLVKSKKSYLSVALLSALVHFSFLIPLLVLFLYVFIGNKTKFYFTLFIISLFVSSLNTDFVKSRLDSLPEVFQQKEVYLNKGTRNFEIKAINNTNWYIRYNNIIINWICYGFLIALFIVKTTLLKTNRVLYGLFNFALFYFAFANIIEAMPQGVRFYPIGQVVLFFLLCVLLNNDSLPKIILLARNAGLPFLVLIFVVSIRRGFEFIGPSTLISNPIIAYWIDNGPPLINFIK